MLGTVMSGSSVLRYGGGGVDHNGSGEKLGIPYTTVTRNNWEVNIR